MGPQPGEDAGFENVASDGETIVAGAAIARVRAAVVVVADLREATAANAAPDETGEKIGRAPGALGTDTGIVMRQIVADVLLPRLDLGPQRVVDDAQRLGRFGARAFWSTESRSRSTLSP